MNQYLTLLIFIAAFFIIIKLLSYKARTGRYTPKVNEKKLTNMFVFFCYVGALILIISLAVARWIK